MKRINLYALIIVTILLILFCLAVANVNAQEVDTTEVSSLTRATSSRSCLSVSMILTNA